MRKLGRKGIIGITIAGVGLIRFLVGLFGDKLFDTWYEMNIGPIIKKNIHIVISSPNETIPEEVLKKGFSTDFISLGIVVIALLYLFALLIRWYFTGYKRNRDVEKENVKKAIDNLVVDKNYIISAQLYQYSSVASGTGRKKARRIDISYYYCKVRENVDINAVIHERFEFEERYYKMVSSFSKYYGEYERTGREKDLRQAKEAVEPMNKTIKEQFEQLTPETITERDCIHFALYKGVKSVLGEELWEDPITGIREDVCNALRFGKRAGCLPSILLQSVYLFRNGASTFKSNRSYWSYAINPKLMPRGLKNALLVLTFAYDQTYNLSDDFLHHQLIREVNTYLTDIKGGAADDSSNKGN